MSVVTETQVREADCIWKWSDLAWCRNCIVQEVKIKVKWFRYMPGVAQRVGRAIALLFHVCGTRRGWVVSRTPWLQFTPGKDPVPILQEAGWAPGPVWMGGKSRPHRDPIPDRPAHSQSLYWLSYPAHIVQVVLPAVEEPLEIVHPSRRGLLWRG
jgi:hypothetical protein